MKKLIISLLAIAATVNVMAIEFTAKATLNLTSQSGEACTMNLYQTLDPKAGSYCAPINMQGRVVALYSISGEKNYQDLYIANLDGIALGLMTNEDVKYTISFSKIQGENLYLFDAVANKYVAIVNGGSYTFTAEANQTIADRFSIVKNIPATFINNKLVIADAAVGAEVNVTPFSFVEGRRVDGQKVTYTAPVNQALNGNYFEVEYTNKKGVARKFIVNANPVFD